MQKTLVVHHHSGIGDLVWHIPYFRAIAATSHDGKVTVMAKPSCRAADLLSGKPWVENVIEFDHRPRDKTKKGKHSSLLAQTRLCLDLKKQNFDRMIIFSGRVRYAIIGLLAGIPVRAGFGFSAAQRLFLNCPPYIERYRGQGSWVYPEATDFAVAHGFVDAPLVPKFTVPGALLDEAGDKLAHLQRPLYALAVGASKPEKNWGMENFARLTRRLLEDGGSVLVMGGPSERQEAEQCFSQLSDEYADRVVVMCQSSVLKSAAALSLCDYCIGNDTGILNIAAAVNVHALGLFGTTRPLGHDPLLQGIAGNGMENITVDAVWQRLRELRK
ncbi:glycosyltransferase family 9 protein [Noviherbaspirillum aridicola]|uniref:Heptosyltransferase n=1 Tax=Noviherbaspirillum aridicola TaxID=2849687 RepID=A0ABQ4Q6Y0_9BURK|nr:glycosyltransferase family 9 protein [Noviherbaspirillum aridicola]GIZ52565.1 heptosyltransferase [Noviherbaspirillum aridicola]